MAESNVTLSPLPPFPPAPSPPLPAGDGACGTAAPAAPREPVRVLLLEDNDADAELIRECLAGAGIGLAGATVDWAATREQFVAALARTRYDLILADYLLPSFDGMSALDLVRSADPDVPFVFVSGTLGEEAAVETLRRGATDYVLRTRLERLCPVVLRALRESAAREQRRRAEAALRESEERFRVTFEQAAVGMAHVSLDGRWVKVNQRLCEIVGYGRDELMALTFQDVTHPEDLETDLAHVRRLLAGECDSYSMEKRYLRKDGSVVWGNLTASLVRGAEGRPRYFISVVEDISQRKRAEEWRRISEFRFQRLIEYSPLSTQIFAPDGTIRQVNRAWEALWGLTAAELPGYNILHDPQLAERGILPLIRRAFEGEAVTIEPIPYVPDRGREAGKVKWCGAYVYPVKDPAGRIEEVILVHQDVTGQKLAEHEQARLAAIVESSDEAIISKDLDGVIRTWNAGAQRLFGYTAGEIVGKSIRLLIPADRQGEEDEILARLRRGERIEQYETVRVRKDGTTVEVSLTTSPMRDASGRVIGASKIARDIGDRKRAEAEVRAARDAAEVALARWRAVVASMSEGLIISDRRGNLLDWNRAALDMHGFAAAEEADKRLEEFPAHWELRRGDGRLVPLEDWPLSRALRGETFTGYELSVRRLDVGTERVISYGGTPVRGRDGSIALAILTLHDMTEERRAQQALRRAAEGLGLALAAADLGDWSWDADTDLITLSPRAAEIFGLPPGTHTTRTKMREMLHEGDRERARLANERAIAGRGDYDIEYRVNRPDGSQVWVAAKGRGRYDESGRLLGMLGVLQDVTARKATEAEREQLLAGERSARAEAERQSRMKDEFLATLSHELRTPLNAILGWAQLLRSARLAEADVAEGLESIERNARVQTALIEDLLDMSRIISGKIRLDVQRVHLPTVVEAAVETVRPAAAAKGIRLRVVLDPLAGSVAGDPNRLQQVVWNLVSNAIKYTPAGGQVQVLLERVHSHLEVSVVDSGEGIDPDFLPHVFDRFRQADGSTTRRHGGLGLGLAIVRHLVELHGGTVRAKSAGPGQGSTFVVSLPVTAVESEAREADPRQRHAEDKPAAPPAVSLAGLRVLVVDDEPDARLLLRRLLEERGAEVVAAASAREAMAALAPPAEGAAAGTPWRLPDLLLSDVGMPEEDGYGLIRRVRALPPDRGGVVPAVALTAYARSEDRTRALMSGFQLHLSKPVEPGELIATVASLAGRIGAGEGDDKVTR